MSTVTMTRVCQLCTSICPLISGLSQTTEPVEKAETAVQKAKTAKILETVAMVEMGTQGMETAEIPAVLPIWKPLRRRQKQQT